MCTKKLAFEGITISEFECVRRLDGDEGGHWVIHVEVTKHKTAKYKGAANLIVIVKQVMKRVNRQISC